jgi:hypothetical protein
MNGTEVRFCLQVAPVATYRQAMTVTSVAGLQALADYRQEPKSDGIVYYFYERSRFLDCRVRVDCDGRVRNR